MRILIFTLSLFLIFCSIVNAQVTVDSERDKEGNVLIFANNRELIPYSVILNFSTLQNLTSTGGTIVTAVAPPGRTQIARLRPTLAGQGTNFGYSFSFAKGNIYGKNKVEPIFLIPVPEGEKVTAMQMTHIENSLGPDRSNEDYVGVSFRLEKPTQIIAPRKGIIAEVKMTDESGAKENLHFSRSENHIEIYHEDGTITRVMVLKPGSEKVKVGDVVYPGDVLAESAGDNYNSGLHVRLVTLKTDKDGVDKLRYNVIPVKFATANGSMEIPKMVELEVVHPLEVIEMEMSKKELKRFHAEK